MVIEEIIQAHCHWCEDPIINESLYDVRFFYNQTWIGYPICNWCSEGLKTNGKRPDSELRKKLGLNPEIDNSLDKWLKKE